VRDKEEGDSLDPVLRLNGRDLEELFVRTHSESCSHIEHVGQVKNGLPATAKPCCAPAKTSNARPTCFGQASGQGDPC
jgi:hypothetical protein